VQGEPFLTSTRDQLIPLTTRMRMSYGTSLSISYRLAAGYVVRIRMGAKPADLPCSKPHIRDSAYLKAARALGLTSPMSILRRARRR